MAIVYQNSNNVGTGTRISTTTTPAVTTGDTLIVDKEAAVISTSGTAIDLSATTAFSIQNFGLIAGSTEAVDAFNTGADVNYSLYNGETGQIVSGATGLNFAVYMGGQNTTSSTIISLSNAGEISNSAQASYGTIFLFYADVVNFSNAGTIDSASTGSSFNGAVNFWDVSNVYGTNTGTITTAAGSTAAGDSASDAAVNFNSGTENVWFNNSGILQGAQYSVGSTATVSEKIMNSGTMIGDVTLSDTVGGVMRNSGDIFGDVDLRGGDDSYAALIDGFVSGTVFGGAGDDTLIGANAADALNGGADSDFLRGRMGDDTVIGGSGNDRLYGEEGNDRLQGDADSDTLFGGADEDVLVGGQGLDVLWGGTDTDTFVYNTFTDSEEGGLFDRIRDFTPGEDKINLLGVASGIDFVSSFTGTGAEVRAFKTSAGLQLVQVDYNGDGSADMRIALLGTDVLATENDFIL